MFGMLLRYNTEVKTGKELDGCIVFNEHWYHNTMPVSRACD